MCRGRVCASGFRRFVERSGNWCEDGGQIENDEATMCSPWLIQDETETIHRYREDALLMVVEEMRSQRQTSLETMVPCCR